VPPVSDARAQHKGEELEQLQHEARYADAVRGAARLCSRGRRG
jgi:hypothetical protein